MQPPPPSFEHQFLPRWNNFVDLKTQDSPKINHPYFMSKFIGSKQARIAAKNATQRATYEPRPERSGKKNRSEGNTKCSRRTKA
ncbi:hypothetical protein NC652_010249 [Populus alba x Populus x berolinensis]|nr:hypothetical protein NC652_010249 [Populus alba x Populus x berolinensis]